MNLDIIFEDEYVIVCFKPSGISTQTKKTGEPDMVSLLKNYLYKKQADKKEPYVGVIHRLDQPVAGLLVFAKTPFAAKELNKNLQEAGFGKYYMAVLCGVPKEQKAILENYLIKDGRTNTSRVCDESEKDAKKAVLSYEVLATRKNTCQNGDQELSLVKVKLDTGRHHQIRVQMANIGCPIWGDTKYNASAMQDKQLGQIALCAYRLDFLHPKTKKQMVFERNDFITAWHSLGL